MSWRSANSAIAGMGQTLDYDPSTNGAEEGLVASITGTILDFLLGREAEKTARERAEAEARARIAEAGIPQPSWFEANKAPILIGGAAIAVLYLFTRKRR